MSFYGYGTRRLRRRALLASGAGLGTAGFLAACGGSNKNKSGTPSTAPAATAATAAGSPRAAATSSRPAGTPAGSPQAGEQPVRGGYARGAGGAQVYDSVDVHRALGDPTLNLSNVILNKLVWYIDPDKGVLEGDLAEKYESPDAQTYTFHLRQDVHFQNIPPANGREFTSDDVRWHCERQAAGKLADGTVVTDFQRKPFYSQITKIETPDKYTITLTFQNPNGSVLDYLAAYFSGIPNKEATLMFEKDSHTLTEQAMIGTGPFQLVQWRAGKGVLSKRNPNYFRPGIPYLDGSIGEAIFEDPNAQRAAFEQKQIDGITPPDDSIAKALLDAHKSATYEVLTGVANTVLLALNMNQQFKDIRLVQALNQAIDRRGLIQSLHQGLGQVSGPVTWLQELYAIPTDQLTKAPGYGTDRAAEIQSARQLWQAGGGPALGDVDIKIPQTWLAVYPATAQILPKMLNDALGVQQFKSTQTDYNTEIIPNLANGKFPNWFGWTSRVNSVDPRQTLFSTFYSKSTSNFNHVNNPDLDQLLVSALQTLDQQKSVGIVRQIQNILLQNAMYGTVVLYNYIVRTVIWNYVHANLKQQPVNGRNGIGWNLPADHLSPQRSWLIPTDPSYQGRPPASIP